MGQEGLHLDGEPFCLLLCGGIRQRKTKAPSSLSVRTAGGRILNCVTYDTFVRISINILFLLLSLFSVCYDICAHVDTRNTPQEGHGARRVPRLEGTAGILLDN